MYKPININVCVIYSGEVCCVVQSRDGRLYDAASKLILITGDILINTPPERASAALRPKETETFLCAFATQRKKGRLHRDGDISQ